MVVTADSLTVESGVVVTADFLIVELVAKADSLIVEWLSHLIF